jgi:hypothetical protein
MAFYFIYYFVFLRSHYGTQVDLKLIIFNAEPFKPRNSLWISPLDFTGVIKQFGVSRLRGFPGCRTYSAKMWRNDGEG